MKKYQFSLAAIFLLLRMHVNVLAQDIHFSYYNSSPLLLNPTLAGMNDGDYRDYANFRMQWMTVSKTNEYRTFAAGADISLGKVTRYNSVTGFKRLMGI